MLEKNVPKKKRIILCICGMAGSGKSSLAKKIAEKYHLKYYSGGDTLKKVAYDMGYSVSTKGWWETNSGLKFLKED